MAYVFPTLVAMGFGYFVTELRAEAPLIGLRWAWRVCAGRGRRHVTAMVPVALGLASVLYTFYPPMIGNPFYYIGVVLVVVGSWIWVALMSVNLYAWKRDNPGAPVPLAMFANGRRLLSLGLDGGRRRARTAVPDHPRGARLTRHDRCRAGARVLLLDAARDRLFLADAGLYRLLHDRPARDRRAAVQRHDGRGFPSSCSWSSRCRSASTTLFEDPQVGAGFKFLHSVFTALVTVPTLLTVFTICASVEIAGRLRGGKGRARLAQRNCPGATRSCWHRRCPSSCSASAAPAASST
jgi:cytochrome c oxidase subunit 1